LAFLVIAKNPVRFRPMMLPSILEKFAYGIALGALYLQGRLHTADLGFGAIDLLFGILFIVAFLKTPERVP
jgi:hypothetical protein